MAPVGRKRRGRRSRRQRVTLAIGSSLALLSAIAAGTALYVASWFGGIARVTIVHATSSTAGAPIDPTPVGVTPTATPLPVGRGPTSAAAIPTTVAIPATTKAMNVLLTGSDGRGCIDPASQDAAAFLANGSDTGSRSDTIIVLRIDPGTKQLALLSFPRDLWVPIAGTHSKSRINSAFRPDDPNALIQTIESTFGLRIDHYIGVDFCAFKSLVDAIGGISIPFTQPARDLHTGLNVDTAGCRQLSGDEALAYVRSRYYEYQVNGRWISDPTSDYGRIARQQDFLRRLASQALARGATNPLTAKHLLDTAHSSNVRIDDRLSLSDLIALGRAVHDIGPESATAYRIEGQGRVIGGASVIVPDLTSPSARAILDLFQGTLPQATDPAATTTVETSPATSNVAPTFSSTPAPDLTPGSPPHDISCP